jgi:ATP-binding cassette subfamily B multidrug efflux pump
MALAGADRIFKLLDEEPEVDDGYVTLVNVRKEGDRLVETEKKTGMGLEVYSQHNRRNRVS